MIVLTCGRPQPPPLQKVTLKCPCGRRVSHTAVPAGQRPGILTCDAECERQKRANRLANAFGIQDPAHHVPWVDRQPRWAAARTHELLKTCQRCQTLCGRSIRAVGMHSDHASEFSWQHTFQNPFSVILQCTTYSGCKVHRFGKTSVEHPA